MAFINIAILTRHFMKPRIFVRFVSISILLLMLGSKFNVKAQPFEGGNGFLYLNAGMMKANVTTDAYFDANIPNVNTTLSLEDDLNFVSDPSLLYLKAHVGGLFQVVGSYQSLHRSGQSRLTKSFAFGDSVYQVGANVDGYFNTDLYSASMRFSIIRNELATAGLSLGLRYLKMEAGVDAESYGQHFIRDGSFNLPIPVVGAHASVYILPRLLGRASLDYFSITIDGTKGKSVDASLSGEYYLLKYLGVGAAFTYFSVDAENLPENDLYLRDIKYHVSGLSLYAALRF